MFNVGKKFVGLVISDSSINISETEKIEKGYKVLNTIEHKLPDGLVEGGIIKNEDELLVEFNKITNGQEYKKISTEEYVFGYPETLIYTHNFYVNKEDEPQIDDLAAKEAKESMPINEEDLIYKYFLLEKTKENAKKSVLKQVLLVGVDRNELLKWQKFFVKASIKISAFDLESSAFLRIFFQDKPAAPICLVSMNAHNTSTYIFNSNGVFFADSTRFGSENIKYKIIEYYDLKGKKIGYEEAEKIIAEIDLNKNLNTESEAVIKQSLKPNIENIIELIKFYELKNGEGIKEIYLDGGISKIKGIKDFYQEIFSKIDLKNYVKGTILKTWGAEIDLGNFQSGIAIKEAEPIVDSIKSKESYYESVGLSMKMLTGNIYDEISIPLLSLAEEEEKKKKEMELQKMNDEKIGKRMKWIKTHSKETKLLAVLFLGVLLIVGAFWYRGNYNKKIQNASKAGSGQQLISKQLDIRIPLAFEGQTIVNQIKVRSFERTIKEPIEFDIAVELSKLEASKKLLANEKIWPTPINRSFLDTKPTPPYAVKILIYNEQLVNSSFIVQAKKLVGTSTLFTVKSTALNDVVEDQKTHELFFVGQITIESEKEIVLPEGVNASNASSTEANMQTSATNQTNGTSSDEIAPGDPVATTTPKYKTVITKYKLQKRSGPGASYPSIGSIGENITLVYIEEQAEYTKVQQENSLFWLKSEYLDFK